jgi:hypothetical protein
MEMVQLSLMTHDKLERHIIPLNKIIPDCDVSTKSHSRICWEAANNGICIVKTKPFLGMCYIRFWKV